MLTHIPHAHTHVHMCAHMHTCAHARTHNSTSHIVHLILTHLHKYMYMYIFNYLPHPQSYSLYPVPTHCVPIQTILCVSVHVCVYIWVFICLCVYLCVCVCVWFHASQHTYEGVCTCTKNMHTCSIIQFAIQNDTYIHNPHTTVCTCTFDYSRSWK